MIPKRLGWVTAVVIGAAAAGGCGEGRVIFNVDVYSFLKGVGQDSVPYLAPSLIDTIPSQQVNLLPTGLGSSVVESVTVAGAIDYDNRAGTGSIGMELYIDTVPNVYSGPPAFAASPVAVTPGQTVSGPFQGDINNIIQQLFLREKVYVGMRVVATGTAAGEARLSALKLRIVVQDKIFK